MANLRKINNLCVRMSSIDSFLIFTLLDFYVMRHDPLTSYHVMLIWSVFAKFLVNRPRKVRFGQNNYGLTLVFSKLLGLSFFYQKTICIVFIGLKWET
jgi:hypothetical protein